MRHYCSGPSGREGRGFMVVVVGELNQNIVSQGRDVVGGVDDNDVPLLW